MVLEQTEYEPEDAGDMLKRRIHEHLANGAHVDPALDRCEIGRRFEVHDASGWLATYWLSEEPLPRDEGMLTSIMSPGARQRAHHSQPRSR